MPDTDMLNIIKVNIHSIDAEDARDGGWCARMHTVQQSNPRQETNRAEKFYTKTDTNSKSTDNNTKPMVDTKANKSTEYFLSSPNYNSNKRKCAEATQQVHKDFDDVFNGIGYFVGTFSLKLKSDSKPYQTPLRCVAHTLQKPFQEELERLQQQDIIAPLGVNDTSEWCNSFVPVAKVNGKVRLCLDLAWLNQTLIRPVHRGPTLNDILPTCNNVRDLSIIDASSWYHK